MNRIYKIQKGMILGILALFPFACGKDIPTSAQPLNIVLIQPTATATPVMTPLTGLDINGPAVTITTGSYNYLYVHIHNGTTVFIVGPSLAVTNAAVTLTCSTYFLMDSGCTVNGNGAGYDFQSGPGAGGTVGIGINNDYSMGPTIMGSGGGAGGKGGALFRVNVPNGTATINGTITMNGLSSNNGGGAGGTIFIQADSILGTGNLLANGGDGGSVASNGGFGGGHGGYSTCAATTASGGGGGGIILFKDHSGNFFTGTVSVSGGTSPSPCGNSTDGPFNETTY
jgi:hypothetical protein